MPDFDVDFDERRRGEVIRYVTEKYGDERVAQIVTYGTIKAKQALKDSRRVLGFPFGMGEKLTKAMPPADHGQGHPAVGHPRHGPPALQGGRRHPRPHRDRRRGEDGLRDGARPREPEAPVGRARRRRHHVERPAHRHHPDHEAGAGRPDRHAVRLPGVRVARPHQDGLPGAAQPHDHRRRARQHRGEPRLPPGARRPRPRRRGRLRAARQGRHARRVPARRRADALAAAADEARQLRGHLGRHRAVPPGADGRELAHQLRPAQERPAADHADPPRARGTAEGHPRHELRPDHLPGAGHGDRAAGGGLLARPGRHPAPRDGQEEEVRARQAVRGLLGRHEGQRLLGCRGQDALGHPAAVLRLRVQQGALGRLRRAQLLDRVPQGALPGRVHGGPADERRRRARQARALPQRVPPHGHQGAPARRQRVDRLLRGRRRRHPLRARRGAQRRLQRRRRHPRGARGEGPLRVVPRLPQEGPDPGRQQAHRRVAGQGGRVRLARAHAPGARRDPRGRRRVAP